MKFDSGAMKVEPMSDSSFEDASPTTQKRTLRRTLSVAERNNANWFRFWRYKYALLGQVAPVALSVVVVRLIIEYAANFTGLYAIGDTGLILTGGIFIIGFMLNGVIADYKEAEKLPGMEEILVALVPLKSAAKPGCSPAAIRQNVLHVVNAIFEWLGAGQRRSDDLLFKQLTELASTYTVPMYDAGPPVSVRLNQEITRLRSMLTRVCVISHSTYLPAGYALVELFVLMASIIVLLARYSSANLGYAVILGVTIIYGGMLLLLRDVDNPFEYTAIPEDQDAHGQAGSTEIDLSVLLDYRGR